MPKDSFKGQKPMQLAPSQALDWRIIAIIGVVALIFLSLVFIIIAMPSAEGSNALTLTGNGIAIITLKGEITNESSGGFGSTAQTANGIVDLIDQAEKDSSIGAILLDIDSPGGEVVASKQIVYKIRASKKPIYSYINSVGASGAYYVAAATKYVMADEDSITGSIGGISIGYNLEGLLKKIGVEAEVLKVGKYKDMGSPYREMTQDENAILQEILEQAYRNFRANVLEFRKEKLTYSQLDSVADGRILTGRQAYNKGLVDELLTRQAAIDKAAELAGIKNPNNVQYGQTEFSVYDLFFSSGKSFGSGFVSSLQVENAPPKIS